MALIFSQYPEFTVFDDRILVVFGEILCTKRAVALIVDIGHDFLLVLATSISADDEAIFHVIHCNLDRDRYLFYTRVRIVVGEHEVFSAEIEDVRLGFIQGQGWQSARLAFEHGLHGVYLVDIDVRVGEAVHVFIGFGACGLSDSQS